jgi:hypothetical protein
MKVSQAKEGKKEEMGLDLDTLQQTVAALERRQQMVNQQTQDILQVGLARFYSPRFSSTSNQTQRRWYTPIGLHSAICYVGAQCSHKGVGGKGRIHQVCWAG